MEKVTVGKMFMTPLRTDDLGRITNHKPLQYTGHESEAATPHYRCKKSDTVLMIFFLI